MEMNGFSLTLIFQYKKKIFSTFVLISFGSNIGPLRLGPIMLVKRVLKHVGTGPHLSSVNHFTTDSRVVGPVLQLLSPILFPEYQDWQLFFIFNPLG